MVQPDSIPLRHMMLLCSWMFLLSCTGQGGNTIPQAPVQPSTDKLLEGTLRGPAQEQISEYIRRMFQDREGNIWFGTNGDGVCRYDGRSLVYYLAGTTVRGIVQDAKGDLWFATSSGVARYDGTNFTRYTKADGSAGDDMWSVVLDRNGTIWFGTVDGVSRFDGAQFTSFALPVPDLTGRKDVFPAPKLVNCIVQDKAGNIWFGTNGGGAYRYDGRKLTNYSEKEGLCNNFVQSIIEDRAGKMWFGTRFGGLCMYDGSGFTSITKKQGLASDFVWSLYPDRAGTLWICSAGGGLCSLRGEEVTCYNEKDGLGNQYVQSILEDGAGHLWIGTSGGVYRFDGKRFTNWTKMDAQVGMNLVK